MFSNRAMLIEKYDFAERKNSFRKKNSSAYSLQRSTTNSAADSNPSTSGSTSTVVSLSPKEVPLLLVANSDHDALSEINVCHSKTAAPTSDVLEISYIEQESSNYPLLRSRSTKRKRNEKLWKRNIQKTARNSDKELIQELIQVKELIQVNSRNIKVKERRINYHRYGNCVNHCNQRLPDARRDELFHDYWKLGEWQRQKDYIANHVMRKQTKRKTKKDSRRKQTFSNFFTVNDQKIKVCKAVFLKTRNR